MVEEGKMSIANTPFFSIVVPVFNTDQKYLKRCFESIDSQAGPSFEVLVVDDGSTNGAGQYCDEWAAQHGKFQVFHQQNKGLSAARNVGINHAVGDYILFVDSDDCLVSDALTNMHAPLLAVQPDVCFCNTQIHDGGRVQTSNVFEGSHARLISDRERENAFLDIVAGVTTYRETAWGKAYKRTFLDANNLRFWEEIITMGEDLLFNLEVLLVPAARFMYSPRTIYIYAADHDGSAIHQYRPYAEKQVMDFLAYMGKKIAPYQSNSRVQRALIHHEVRFIFWIIYAGIKNENNRSSRKAKVQRIKQLVHSHPYAEALKHCKLSWFSGADRVKITLLRLKAYGLYLLL